jgi:hypothetical protein
MIMTDIRIVQSIGLDATAVDILMHHAKKSQKTIIPLSCNLYPLNTYRMAAITTSILSDHKHLLCDVDMIPQNATQWSPWHLLHLLHNTGPFIANEQIPLTDWNLPIQRICMPDEFIQSSSSPMVYHFSASIHIKMQKHNTFQTLVKEHDVQNLITSHHCLHAWLYHWTQLSNTNIYDRSELFQFLTSDHTQNKCHETVFVLIPHTNEAMIFGCDNNSNRAPPHKPSLTCTVHRLQCPSGFPTPAINSRYLQSCSESLAMIAVCPWGLFHAGRFNSSRSLAQCVRLPLPGSAE